MTGRNAFSEMPSPREQVLLERLDEAMGHAIHLSLAQAISADVSNVLIRALHAAELAVRLKDPVFAKRVLDLASTLEEDPRRKPPPRLTVIQGGEQADDPAIF